MFLARLKVAANIICWFPPPHSPESNPIEGLGAGIKGQLAWHLFDIEHLLAEVSLVLKTLSHSFLSSLTGKTRLVAELAILKNTTLYRG